MKRRITMTLMASALSIANAQEANRCDSSCVLGNSQAMTLASAVALNPLVDQCKNLLGVQGQVPKGYGQDKGGFCLPVPASCPLENWTTTTAADPNGLYVPWCGGGFWKPEPFDMCDNIAGLQDDVPAGYTESGGVCTPIPPPPPPVPPGKTKPLGPWPVKKMGLITTPVWKTGYSNGTALIRMVNASGEYIQIQNTNTGQYCTLEYLEDECSFDAGSGLYYGNTAINLVNNALGGDFFFRESGARGIEKVTVTVKLTMNSSLEIYSYYSGMALDWFQTGSYAYIRADKMILESSIYASFNDFETFVVMPTPLDYASY